MSAGKGCDRRGTSRRHVLARELRRLLIEQGPGMWTARGACRDLGDDADVMFPAAELGSPGYWDQLEAARAVCAGCPVRTECLSYALTAGEDGVWGGTDDDERRALRRHQAATAADSTTEEEAA